MKVKKIEKKFLPDFKRVIVKPHMPGSEAQITQIIKRVLSLDETQVEKILGNVVENFGFRHKNIFDSFSLHFSKIKKFIPQNTDLSEKRKALIGAFFSCEYSIQSAAFFNPSIIPHPCQDGMSEDCMKFIMSFRSVGEGHISSIEFRSGTVNGNCEFSFDEVSKFAEKSRINDKKIYNKALFFMKLADLPNYNEELAIIVHKLLGEEFNYTELISVLQMVIDPRHKSFSDDAVWLAQSNYELVFNEDCELSEKVIFPASNNDCNGIEDARFVKFTDEDGSITYYATYTAYNGHNILPQLIETKDFNKFKVMTLCGKFSKNKGMALFPRKINGKYMMISRIDGENLYVMQSDNIYYWSEAELLKIPQEAWEFVQIGNCGSPIETDKGWILLTHGVGPMREYSIGVTLLDIANPSKIISNINEPLLKCSSDEREGYVPNVVYTCGAMIHNNNLIIPYAMSDTCCGIATVALDDLFQTFKERESQVYDTSAQKEKN